MNFEKPRGIAEFIEKKRNIEKERPELTAESRLITIDGVDGSGKTGLAKHMVDKLKETYGDDQVILVDATNLKGSINQEQLKDRAKKKDLSEDVWNKVYAAGVNRAYNDLVVPALESGKLVVVDRSEVDLLRFAILHDDEQGIDDRKRYIEEGTLTHRYWPGNRISLRASKEDVWNNLQGRVKKSKYDPQSIDEVDKFIEAEIKAEQIITEIKHKGDVNYLNVENPRVDDPSKLSQHLDLLAQEVISQLEIQDKAKTET